MNDIITVRGIVATEPRHLVTESGLAITSIRLASPSRRWDRASSGWANGPTNWFTVTAFRTLATNAAKSLSKGDRIIVTGRLRVRPWQRDDRTGTSVEIDAEGIGHDLAWGVATWMRVPRNIGDAKAGPGESATVNPATGEVLAGGVDAGPVDAGAADVTGVGAIDPAGAGEGSSGTAARHPAGTPSDTGPEHGAVVRPGPGRGAGAGTGEAIGGTGGRHDPADLDDGSTGSPDGVPLVDPAGHGDDELGAGRDPGGVDAGTAPGDAGDHGSAPRPGGGRGRTRGAPASDSVRRGADDADLERAA